MKLLLYQRLVQNSCPPPQGQSEGRHMLSRWNWNPAMLLYGLFDFLNVLYKNTCCVSLYSMLVADAGDVAECILRRGACLNLDLNSLPEDIAAHDYNLFEPPDSSASWVEALIFQAGEFKAKLERIPSLEASFSMQVSPVFELLPPSGIFVRGPCG